jgi:hypothetical protein
VVARPDSRAVTTRFAPPVATGVLGVSVQPALVPAPEVCDDTLAARVEELVREAAANTLAAALVGVRVFASDTCVICLDADPPPDCLFLPCGHQAVHYDEAGDLRACVMCRRAITARLIIRDGRIVRREDVPEPVRMVDPRRRDAFYGNFPLLARKPVVYLYPPAPTDAEVTVRLAVPGDAFTALIPAPARCGGGVDAANTTATWRVRASPDGILTPLPAKGAGTAAGAGGAPVGGGIAPTAPPVGSLFWEAETGVWPGVTVFPPGETFCVRGVDVGDWLLDALPRAGLSPREYTEMATFWAVKMARYAWVALRLAPAAALDAVAPLKVSPQPGAVLRVYLVCRGLAAPLSPAAAAGILPASAPPARDPGVFTVVEWGGTEVPAAAGAEAVH